MYAVLVDRSFEFMPNTMDTTVKATVGVSCDTEQELMFLISHLESLDLQAAYSKHQADSWVKPPEEKSKLRLKADVDNELEKDFKESDTNAISSLELD